MASPKCSSGFLVPVGRYFLEASSAKQMSQLCFWKRINGLDLWENRDDTAKEGAWSGVTLGPPRGLHPCCLVGPSGSFTPPTKQNQAPALGQGPWVWVPELLRALLFFGGVDLVPFQDLGFDEQHFLNSVLQNCSSKRCLKNKTKPKAEQKGKKSKRAVEDDVP